MPTFRLRLVDGDRVFLDPRPLPPGTFVEPLSWQESIEEKSKGSVKEGLDEFFVGYLPVPVRLARFARGVAGVALVGLAAVAGALASVQRPLGQGQFAWDTESEFCGRLQTSPVPGLWTVATAGSAGTPFTGAFLPLVGEGKHGPDADLVVAGDRDVVLRGHRIERYGKQLIEVTGESSSGGKILQEPGMAPPAQVALGRQLLRGEIVDSKCWFGVMKPAQGKAHKDCAIRCISGGAPPAFVVRSAGTDGRERTLVLLLAATDGAPLGPRILDRVAEPVEITGEVSRLGDQWVLSTDPATIHRIGG